MKKLLNKIRWGTLKIGRGKRKYLGGLSWGLELSLHCPEMHGIAPRMEIYYFRLMSFPPRGSMFRKDDSLGKRDIKGFWKIIWWQPSMVIKQVKLFERKGWRTRYVSVPVKITGMFRVW